MERIGVAIAGANGYSGEELVRLVLEHPRLDLLAVTSRQHADKALAEVFPRFSGLPGSELCFSRPDPTALTQCGAQFFFLALPHGVSASFAVPLLEAGARVIDISADFRLRDAATYHEFYGEEHPSPEFLTEAVYGLPEWRREEIRSARLVAAPGCYPTSVLLPLLPLLRDGLLEAGEAGGIFISSASGTTGAGRKSDETLLFAECNENFRSYGIPKHRHLSEIEQELTLAAGNPVRVVFVPHLLPCTRGIHTTIFAKPTAGVGEKELLACWQEAYAGETFVRVRKELPAIRHVVGTNFCDLSLRMDPRTGNAILLSVEDNLLKGAGGQGVQCLNIMAGFQETEGLL